MCSSDLPAATETPSPVEPTNGSAPRVMLRSKQSDQAHICLGVRGYPLVHPDRYAVQLLTTILGGGMSSRLFTEVRERRGLAYYVFGFHSAYTDAGSLVAQAGVDIDRIDEAIGTIVTELRRIAEEPVPDQELETARNSTKGRFALQLESPHSLLMFGLRRALLEGTPTEPDEVMAGLDAVTGEDLQRVAGDLLGDTPMNLALVGPFDDPERFEKLL